MSDLVISGARLLHADGSIGPGSISVVDGRIAEVSTTPAGMATDAGRYLVLPGIVDLHGDAFERQLMPRPGVHFAPVPALLETDRQLLSNGITTAFHGVTLSWEPGLRSVETWSALIAALAAHRPSQRCDMRIHLRWEAFNLSALDLALEAIVEGRVHLLAFNDHTPGILRKLSDSVTGAKYSERAGMQLDAFREYAGAIGARAPEVPGALAQIAAAASETGIPMASHDDANVAARDGFRAMGARISDFPMNAEVARAATEAGDSVIMGSPNVVRGGSHMGWVGAAAMVEAGFCQILTSDYFYPAMLQAAFLLAKRHGPEGLAARWALIAANPARAAGLKDRGRIERGLRADLVIVKRDPTPHVVATIAGGELAYLSAEGAARLH
jgi:alpha-D-ribose 1-methylphosphonate 5-triphosphate diphosphatase